jgi:hypothetical protein
LLLKQPQVFRLPSKTAWRVFFGSIRRFSTAQTLLLRVTTRI